MDAAVLLRTGSGRFQFPSTPAEHHHLQHDLPLLSRARSVGAAGFSTRTSTVPVHLHMTRNHNQRHQPTLPNTLRRAASCDYSDAASASASASASFFRNNTGSPAILSLGVSGGAGRSGSSSHTAKSALVDEELELEVSGGGAGRGGRVGGGRRPGGGSGDQNGGMGAYYKEMLQSDPENPLLLINYGKFLHEVEANLQGAEDCFARAVLASPADGEALSLYATLIWEAHRDQQRADGYFQRAAQAAPDDCYVLASYANFLWDADDDEDNDVEGADNSAANGSAAPPSSSSSSSTAAGNAVMVKAY